MYLTVLRGPASWVNATQTTLNVSQVIQVAKTRSFIQIQNNSAQVMWLQFGGVAAVDNGYQIPAGGTWTSPPNFCPQNSINIVSATTGNKFSYMIF